MIVICDITMLGQIKEIDDTPIKITAGELSNVIDSTLDVLVREGILSKKRYYCYQ